MRTYPSWPLKMQVLPCVKQARVLNVVVVSAIGVTRMYSLGPTGVERLKLKAAYLLQWRAMQWLKERGCRWYDLGCVHPFRYLGV